MSFFDLSIIIPAYNCEKYIEKCINSVLRCPYDNYEVIVVNDGSKDSTADIVKTKFHNNMKVRLFNQENGGVSSARNNGISNSKKDYIMFLDSDDHLVDKWWTLLSEADGSGDIYLCDYVKHYKDKNVEYSLNIDSYEVSKEDILKKYVLTDSLNSCWAKIYKRSFLVENNINFPCGVKIGEDAIFVGKALLEATSIFYIPQIICIYEDNLESATHKSVINLNDQKCLFENKKKVMEYTGTYYQDYFYKKFLGDFMSILRQASFSYKEYLKLCTSSVDYPYVKEIINYAYGDLDIRRKLQIILYKHNIFGLLYLEMKLERFLNK